MTVILLGCTYDSFRRGKVVWRMDAGAAQRRSRRGCMSPRAKRGRCFPTSQSGAKEVRLRPLSVVPVEKSAFLTSRHRRRGARMAPSRRQAGAAKGASGWSGDSRRDDAASAYANFLDCVARGRRERGRQYRGVRGASGGRAAPVAWRGPCLRGAHQRARAGATFYQHGVADSPSSGAIRCQRPISRHRSMRPSSMVPGALKRAAPVRFFMRYATVLNRPHPLGRFIRFNRSIQSGRSRRSRFSRSSRSSPSNRRRRPKRWGRHPASRWGRRRAN